jgi:hypothetical protein
MGSSAAQTRPVGERDRFTHLRSYVLEPHVAPGYWSNDPTS